MRTHGLRWVAIGVLLIAVLFSSCRLPLSRNNKSVMGFDPSAFSVVEERDTHGGFLGDGDYYLILDCSSNADEAKKIIEDVLSQIGTKCFQSGLTRSDNILLQRCTPSFRL